MERFIYKWVRLSDFRWVRLSDRYRFQRLDNILLSAGIEYVSYGNLDMFGNQNIKPEWGGAYHLMEKFGLSSNDAAILNMCSTATELDGILTTDNDVSSAVAVNAVPGLI